ncbi:hypothetical protein JZ751_007385 [Albula glossodonta]|uniref:C2H2-type domain-containing protein n=1 Tax=Albula glossodonta TaxID=121402 RepID=A0A8T2MNN6_9TELE|nr:hypothetical protein JZ751_007385 [Albula glossodonta]
MTCRVINLLAASPMDSPPECVLALPSEPPTASPTLPSLDHSPLPPQHSPSLDHSPLPPQHSPSSPPPGHQLEEEEDDEESALPSPAVASFPREPLGFGVLEQALSSSQDPLCSAELDLQLFHNGHAQAGEADGAPGDGPPPRRFPCKVCGKRFRFNSILSLHARAHVLERDRHNQNQKSSHSQDQSPALPVSPPPMTRDPPPLTAPPTEEAPPFAIAPAAEDLALAAVMTSLFHCHACKGKFRTASELSRHVRILHNPYKCSMCAFSASQEEALATHLQDSHPTEELPGPAPGPSPTPGPTPGLAPLPLPAFRCETCGQRFTQSWFLKGHMRKHKASLDHKCQVCGRGFKEPWFLKNHMKVHLNKLGLKAGGASSGGASGGGASGGGASGGGAPASSQALGALYSSLLLSRAGGARAREAGDRGKASLLGYLGLPGDGGGSCMERLQAVAQVAERGGAGVGGGASSGGGAPWQLVARSMASGQQGQQRAPKSSVAGEAEQVRAYLGGLLTGGHAPATPWECPDCGKLFRSLQQAVAHVRVHVQRPHREEPRKLTNPPKPQQHTSAGFHSTMAQTQGYCKNCITGCGSDLTHLPMVLGSGLSHLPMVLGSGLSHLPMVLTRCCVQASA